MFEHFVSSCWRTSSKLIYHHFHPSLLLHYSRMAPKYSIHQSMKVRTFVKLEENTNFMCSAQPTQKKTTTWLILGRYCGTTLMQFKRYKQRIFYWLQFENNFYSIQQQNLAPFESTPRLTKYFNRHSLLLLAVNQL